MLGAGNDIDECGGRDPLSGIAPVQVLRSQRRAAVGNNDNVFMGLEVMGDVVYPPPFRRQDGGVTFVLIIKVNDDRGVEEGEWLVVEHRDMRRMENRGRLSGVGEGSRRIPALLRGYAQPRSDRRNRGPYF